jgi:protein KTI12
MALITICGYPCSGKSTRAQQIQTYLQSKLSEPDYAGPQLKLTTISDETLSLPRSVYNESKTEKPARGSLLSAMQRHANSDTVLIIDAPNYIKGFRYQMYCIARELKLRVCTVYVIATPAVCKERNERRTDEGAQNAYAPETCVSPISISPR